MPNATLQKRLPELEDCASSPPSPLGGERAGVRGDENPNADPGPNQNQDQAPDATSPDHSKIKNLKSKILDQAVTHAATQWGLRPTALPDLAWRADKSFEIIDGEVCALDPVNGTIRVGPDGLAPMTVAQWVEELTTEAPHLFEDSSGARAQGSKTSHSPGHNNPSKKGPHFNLTQQMILIRRDPVMAARLKSAAD